MPTYLELTPAERARVNAELAEQMLSKPVPPTQVALAFATLAIEARLEQIANLLTDGIAVAGVDPDEDD